jgi:hypothetical protein
MIYRDSVVRSWQAWNAFQVMCGRAFKARFLKLLRVGDIGGMMNARERAYKVAISLDSSRIFGTVAKSSVRQDSNKGETMSQGVLRNDLERKGMRLSSSMRTMDPLACSGPLEGRNITPL